MDMLNVDELIDLHLGDGDRAARRMKEEEDRGTTSGAENFLLDGMVSFFSSEPPLVILFTVLFVLLVAACCWSVLHEKPKGRKKKHVNRRTAEKETAMLIGKKVESLNLGKATSNENNAGVKTVRRTSAKFNRRSKPAVTEGQGATLH